MKPRAYYNENDPRAAEWLRELIRRGLIAYGDVDTRSITEVQAHELYEYTQHHFFAGIGGWSLALRLAGWPDNRPVCTGSCPCQPFSQAGKGLGYRDPRHLWPYFLKIITECGFSVVFGEQVASKAGRQWLARVRADLEKVAYAFGAADLCAAGVGAPHIRQRLYWVANAQSFGRGTRPLLHQSHETRDTRTCDGSSVGGLADADGVRRDERWEASGSSVQGECSGREGAHARSEQDRELSRGSEGFCRCGVGGLVDAPLPQGSRFRQQREQLHRSAAWSASEVIPCADGKARRIESGTFPLAHGIPGRVGLLRGYGNAIVPQIAAQFIASFMDLTQNTTSAIGY